MISEASSPLRLFCCYADEDEIWYDQVEKHLSNLRRQNLITLWSKRHISPGSEWKREYTLHFTDADIVLLFISSSFMAEDDYNDDIQQALEKHRAGTARVIPILLSPVDWKDTPFQTLQALPTNGIPIIHWQHSDDALHDIVQGIRKVITEMNSRLVEIREYKMLTRKNEVFLKALIADHRGFMQDRLESFVGREQELKAIRHLIVKAQQTGGYVTITGQAGQGKSSIIAKLVEEYGAENVAVHFIPFNSGPDHQVGLLRNLMAYLILKYRLSDLYVVSESRPALRDYFPKVLKEVVAMGGHEVIFIDGLDQLEEEQTGVRDLSFLPNNPPPGIVFVLGTRPNDTLMPLELLKPRHEYPLPNLSRHDFDLILQHRQVSLNQELADQFYILMEENALYLDLVARELKEQQISNAAVIIARLIHNPENLFSLAMERLKRHPHENEWQMVIKPILGVLMVTREPLSVRNIRQILQRFFDMEEDRLMRGLKRLGGLITENWQHRYSLFHLKLHEYLRQDERLPRKEYVFASDEEQALHKQLAQWCEQSDLSTIWQDLHLDQNEQLRREYARRHYITHLYQARTWNHLFEILDTGKYGKDKIRLHDPSALSYAQDLDLGPIAAAWEGWALEDGIGFLSNLWRYTLLRCTLTSRANQYPVAAFRLLVQLKRTKEALGLAELLTNPVSKVKVLLEIFRHMEALSEKEAERSEILLRISEVVNVMRNSERTEALRELIKALAQAQRWEWAEVEISTIQDGRQRAEALRELGKALAQAQRWEQAERIWKQAEVEISTIQDGRQRAEALRELGKALAQAQRWEQAEAVISIIQDDWQHGEALRELGKALAQAQRREQAEAVISTIQDSWQQVRTLRELGLALAQVQDWEQTEAVIATIQDSWQRGEALRELGLALAQVQDWKRAEKIWEQAEAVISTIQDSWQQSEALRELGRALAQTQYWEGAERIWKRAESVISAIQDGWQQGGALYELGRALAQAQHWEQAESVISAIQDGWQQGGALRELGRALAQAQHWEQAESVISAIQDGWQQGSALRELGRALAQAQHWEQAEKIWKQAEVVIATIQDREQRIEVLCELGETLAQVQQWEQAYMIWKHVNEEVATIQDREIQAEALRELGKALAQVQHWERAERIWKQAEAVISTIQDGWQQTVALCELGRALAQAQRWEHAEAVIATIQDRELHAEALCELGKALAQAQRWEHAEAVIATIQDRELHAEALWELGRALAQAQRWEHAEAVISTIQDDWQQAAALPEMGKVLAQAQHREQAETMISTIRDRELQASVLREPEKAIDAADKYKQLLEVIQRSWLQVETRGSAIKLLALVTGLIPIQPDIGLDCCEAFTWVDHFLRD